MQHKNFGFKLDEIEPGIWQWEYEIGAEIQSGKFPASSRGQAIRRVHQKMDRDLRIQYLAQRGRGVT